MLGRRAVRVAAIVVAASVVVSVAGCMTDGSGRSCPWLPGNDGTCSGGGGGGASGPTYHSYLSPTAAAIGDAVRVAVTGAELGTTVIETTVVRDGAASPIEPVLLDGSPLEAAIVPQLAAIGDEAYLVWTDLDDDAPRTHGAPLASDGAVRGDAIVDLGTGDGTLTRVGGRYLYVHAADPAGTVYGTWIRPDGQRDGELELARGVYGDGVDDVSDDGTGATTVAIAWRTSPDAGATFECRIARITLDGARPDGDGLLIARAITGESWIRDVEVVATADGGMLATYQLQRGLEIEVRVVRVDPDGRPTDALATMPGPLQLVAGRGEILALAVVSASEGTPETLEGRLVDARGAVIGGPFVVVPAAARSARALATADGFAVIHPADEADVALTSITGGAPAVPVALATSYELEGCGCSAGSDAGPRGVLAVGAAIAAALRRRRRAA